MRRVLHVAICMVVSIAGFAFTSEAPATETRREVSGWSASQSSSPSRTRRKGTPPASSSATATTRSAQSKTAVLLLHGLSYTKEAWDFPGYSVAQEIAKAGYTVFAYDRLGYGESKLENGHMVTHEAMAGQANQVIDAAPGPGLRAHRARRALGRGRGDRVPGRCLRRGRRHHGPRAGITGRPTSSARTSSPATRPGPLQDDYEYFLGTPAASGRDVLRAQRRPGGGGGRHQGRRAHAQRGDPHHQQAAVALRHRQDQRCRSSSSSATKDRLFELQYARMHAEEFRSSPSVTVDVVPVAGHTFMLTKEGMAGTERMVEVAPVAARRAAVLPLVALVLRGAALPQGDDGFVRRCPGTPPPRRDG